MTIIGILCFSQRLENLGFVSKNSSLEINGLKVIINNECHQKSKKRDDKKSSNYQYYVFYGIAFTKDFFYRPDQVQASNTFQILHSDDKISLV